MPWLRECSKNWAEKDSEDNENLFEGIDEEIPFNDFLIFLRRLQRRNYYEKRYYESKVAAKQEEPTPAIPKSKVDGPKKKKPTKKPANAGWHCPFCLETWNYHPAEKCLVFTTLPRADKVKAFRKHNRCLNCLKPSHVAKDSTRPKCGKCQEAHHSSLHPESNKKEPGNGF